MRIAPKVMPAYAALGVPWSRPVVRSNDAQGGLFVIANRSRCRSASRATGRKLYCSNARADVAGAPEMLGAVLAATAVSGVVHETRNNAPTNAGTPRFMLTPLSVRASTDGPCRIPGAVVCDRGVEAPLDWRDSRRQKRAVVPKTCKRLETVARVVIELGAMSADTRVHVQVLTVEVMTA